MGHRAYIAYEQKNGTFSLHYSHWGAHDFALCDRITDENPLGGPNDLEPKYIDAFVSVLDGVADENDMDVAGEIVEKQNEKCVEPEPIKQYIQFEEVIETIGSDSGIETLYVVEHDYTVHGFRVEMLRVGGETIGNVLIRPRSRQGDTDKPYSAKYERGYVSGVRKQLTRLTEQGILSIEEAKEEAIDSIVEWAANRSSRLLAHSTAIPNTILEDNPRAFLDTTSAHRYFGEMIPVTYGDVNSWAIPDEISIPPAFSRIEDKITTEVEGENEQTADEQIELSEIGGDDSTDTSILPDVDSESVDLPDVDVDPDTYKYDQRRVAFTVNGEPFSGLDIPKGLRDKLNDYKEFSRAISTELTSVYECEDCRERENGFEYGYLTDSENTDSYNNQYTCGRSWDEFSTPHTLHVGGGHAPEAWVVHTAFENGDDKRCVEEVTDETSYTITVSEMDEFRGEDSVIESSTMTVSPPEDVELPDSGVVEGYPETTVSGETNGKEWELTARFGASTLQVEWERIENGSVIEYKYRNPDDRSEPKEFIGVTPIDVEGNDIVVDRLSSSSTSHVLERTCGGTDFKKVWPPDDLRKRNVSVPDVECDEVPNTAQHLSRIQSGLQSPVSKDEIEELISRAAYQLQDTYNVYGEFSETETGVDDHAAVDAEDGVEETVNT